MIRLSSSVLTVVMAVSYAYVRYLKDQEKEIVDVKCIRNFSPKDCDDFSYTKAYWVRWIPAEEESPPARPNVSTNVSRSDNNLEDCYKAQILLLGKNYKELEEKIESNRVRVTKILDTSIEESDDSEDGISLSQISKQRKASKKLEATAKSRALRQILSEKMESRKKCLPFATDTNCEGSSSKKEASNNKTDHLLKRTAELEKEKAKLEKENEELQFLNRKLQRALLGKLMSKCPGDCKDKVVKKNPPIDSCANVETKKDGPTPPTVNLDFQKAAQYVEDKREQTIPDNDAPDSSEKPSNYKTVGDKVHLGNDVFIPERSWDMLQAQKKNSVFVKNLAVAVWGTSNLKDRSLEGKICPRFKENSPKPPLTPVKLKTVKRCFEDRLHQQKLDDKTFMEESCKFKRYITEKIMDINRAERKKSASGQSSTV